MYGPDYFFLYPNWVRPDPDPILEIKRIRISACKPKAQIVNRQAKNFTTENNVNNWKRSFQDSTVFQSKFAVLRPIRHHTHMASCTFFQDKKGLKLIICINYIFFLLQTKQMLAPWYRYLNVHSTTNTIPSVMIFEVMNLFLWTFAVYLSMCSAFM